jgi:thiol-disulfide isomerase/thioredoxin
LGLLNLLLLVGVIRRLREHTEQLARVQKRGNSSPSLKAGSQVARFETPTVDGRVVSAESLGADAVVGFFKPGCEPCEQALPAFVDYARTFPSGRAGVLAVVVGTDDEVQEVVNALSPAAQVVVEQLNGAVSEALSVEAFPTFVRIGPDQRVSAVGYDPSIVMLEPAL